MAKGGFRVMDSDMHVVEPADLWERYIAPAFRGRAPQGLRRHPRDLGVRVGGNVFPLPNRSYSNAIAPLMTGQQGVYADAERLLIADAAIIPLRHASNYALVKPRVQGFRVSPFGTPEIKGVTLLPE